MSSLWIASSVSTTNGSNLVTVQSNEDITGIRPNSLIQVGANPLMEVKRTFLTDSGVKTIELFENWEFGAVTGQRAIAAPTLGEIKSLADDVRRLISSAEEIIETTNLNPAGGSIAKRTSDGRVKTANATEANDAVAYGQFDGLETELRGAVDQSIADNEAKFNQIETQAKFDEHATLIMDYANNDYRVYEQFEGKASKLASQIETFTRGSSKTGFTPTGLATAGVDVPFNVIDPVTGASLGRSIEEQRTNLLLWSEDFSNDYWDTSGKRRADVTPNTEDGATKIVLPNGLVGGFNFVFSIYNVDISAARVMSIDVKSAGERYFAISNVSTFSSNPTICAVIDVELGEAVSINTFAFNLGVDVIKLNDGWFRINAKADRNVAGYSTFSVGASSSPHVSGVESYVGDGASGFYIRRAQVEQASFPTSYIKTEGTQVTRQADVCSIEDIDQSDWWNPNEGTFVVEFSNIPSSLDAGNVLPYYIAGIGQTSSITSPNGLIALTNRGSNTISVITRGPVNGVIGMDPLGISATGVYRACFSYDAGSGRIAFACNGSTVISLNRSDLSDMLSNVGVFKYTDISNCNYGSTRYAPKALSDLQLQELSTL